MSAVLPATGPDLVPPPAAFQGGFFAHHGIWAPGVRLFRNLRFSAKAVTISLAFMLPMLGLVGWLLQTQAEQATAAQLAAQRQQVQVAHGLLQWAHAEEVAGRWTRLQAQQQALQALAAVQGSQSSAVWLIDRVTQRPPLTPDTASRNPARNPAPAPRWGLRPGAADANDAPAAAVAAVAAVAAFGAQASPASQASQAPQASQVLDFEPWRWSVGIDTHPGNSGVVPWRQLAWTGGIVLLAQLVAGYLFLSFYRVVDGGLRETRRHLRAMAAGDLTTQPRAWGHDESAQGMLELCRMQASLRSMVARVRDCSAEIGLASDHIADGAAELSARTDHAATALEQSAASMAQILVTVKHGAEHTEEASRMARHNAEVAAEGKQVMREVVDTMEGIRVASARIGDIVGTIDGIAFLTNILALNAAVEAARAGPQGRGFAVVASEVRLLAQRSAASAKEIKELVGGSVQQVEAGSQVVRKAGSAMQDIVASSQRVNELLGEVATAARAQSLGIDQVGQAVGALDQVTQQNATLGGQTAQSAAAMRERAQTLAEAVAGFKLQGQAH